VLRFIVFSTVLLFQHTFTHAKSTDENYGIETPCGVRKSLVQYGRTFLKCLHNDQEIPGNSSTGGGGQITLSLLSASSIKCTPTELDVCMIPFNITLLFNSVSIVTGLLNGDCAFDVRFHLGIKQLSSFY
jgi:hypothetical protein